jgi:hypothetical protein
VTSPIPESELAEILASLERAWTSGDIRFTYPAAKADILHLVAEVKRQAGEIEALRAERDEALVACRQKGVHPSWATALAEARAALTAAESRAESLKMERNEALDRVAEQTARIVAAESRALGAEKERDEERVLHSNWTSEYRKSALGVATSLNEQIDAAMAEVKRQAERVRKLEEALKYCADSLEEEVRGFHGVDADSKLEEMHDVQVRRFNRDMSPVLAARAALEDGR